MQLLFDKEKNNIRCVLPGTSLPLGKNGEYLEQYFKDNYDINVEYLVEAKTVPGKGHMHNRIDQIFTVQEDSVERFAKIKNEINAEYAKDIVRLGNHRLYNEHIYIRYFKRIEDKLKKSGEITENNLYQSKLG